VKKRTAKKSQAQRLKEAASLTHSRAIANLYAD